MLVLPLTRSEIAADDGQCHKLCLVDDGTIVAILSAASVATRDESNRQQAVDSEAQTQTA